MKFNKIKAVAVMMLGVLSLGAFSGCSGKEADVDYTVEVSTSAPDGVTTTPSQTQEPTTDETNESYDTEDNNLNYLSKEEVINKITEGLQDNWEYYDVDYNAKSNTLHVYIGTPSIISTLNKIPYNTKLKEMWMTETQPAIKNLNVAMVDLFKRNGHRTHVSLFYIKGSQREKLILGIHDGIVVYDEYLKIDTYDINPAF